MDNFGVSAFVQSLFAGYKEAKKDAYRQHLFDELEYLPVLFSSNHLNNMYQMAKTKDEHNAILEHLYRYDATEVPSYKKIENKIIDLYREPIKGGKRR